MIWLLVQMWVYLAAAFVLGMLAYRWVFGGGSGLAAEDVSAELASVRTRHQEAEAERARLRARIVELTNELEEAQRQARSAAAVARTAAQEVQAPEPPQEAPEPAPAPQPEPPPEPPSEAAQPDTEEAPSPEPPQPEEEPAAPKPPKPSEAPVVEEPPSASAASAAIEGPTPFLATPERGPPDDLTRIRGIGSKLQQSLNALGIYYYWQVAGWTDGQVAEVDAHLSFPGRIDRERWRAQAQRLMEQMSG